MMKIVYCGSGAVGDDCLRILLNSKFEYNLFISPLSKGKDFDDFLFSIEDVDVILSVHWPFIFREKHINFPKHGILNLHNSFLPWNKGADACSWAIVENSPHGATMHKVDTGLDSGPIFVQSRIAIADEDTTDTLYKRTVKLEKEVFQTALEKIFHADWSFQDQVGEGSFHKKADFVRILRAAQTNLFKVSKV